MIIVWVNKRNWKHPGPIVNMSVHNAHSFASIGLESHLCLGESAPSDTAVDLQTFYGLAPLPNFNVHRIAKKRRLFGGDSGSVYRAARKLICELAKKDDVAVFTRECGFLVPLAWMCRKPRIRGFYELHDLFADLSWRQYKPRGKELREKWLERLFLPRISGLICITREMEKRYKQIFPQMPSIAQPLGTKSLPATDPEKKRLARTLVYVGHMHGPKGISFLQTAAFKLAMHGVRTEFWGGYEKDALKMQAAAAQKGLSEWIHALPFQPPAVMHEALAERASLGVVMLADTYYNRYLTCPVKALDYLTHGIPALGTDIESVREVLDTAGIYIPENDVEAFTHEVLRLLDDSQAYADATLRTQKRAAQITWEERAKALVSFSRSLF
jgi:glycosyltransferase involved in cell wall biosynthesis